VVNTTYSVHNNNPAVGSSLMWRAVHLTIAFALLSGYALFMVYLGNAVVTLIWGE
jgi:hypothetical protein